MEMPVKRKEKPAKRPQRGRPEERLIITGDAEAAFQKLLKPKPSKKKKP